MPAMSNLTCHCTLMRKTNRKLAALYDAALAPHGINIAQFALLRNIERRQPVSLTELARLLELDRSTMGRNIRVLQKQDLVLTSRGTDQREAAVSLTERGMTVLRAAEPAWEGSQDAITARIGADRIRILHELNQLL